MAFQFGQGIPTETPASRLAGPSFGEKATDFLFPTSKSTFGELGQALQGEEVPERGLTEQLRRGVGTGLELASFAPAGRAVKIGIEPITSFMRGLFKKGATETAETSLKGLAKAGAREGGAAGALFEGGQAVADPEAEIDDILKGVGLGALYGTVGGAVAVPALSKAGSAVAKGASRVTNRVVDQDALVKNVSDNVFKSLVGDKTGVLNAFDKINARFGRSLGNLEPEELIEEMIREGLLPEARGEVARTVAQQKTAREGIRNLSEGVTRLVAKSPNAGKQVISLQDFNDAVRTSIKENPAIDKFKAERQFKSEMSFYKRKYGGGFTPENLDEVRRRANKGGGKKGTPVADVNSEIGRVSRTLLDEVDLNIRRLNAESQRLMRIEATLKALNNKKIDTGYFGSFLGRLLATVGVSQIGVTGALLAGPLAGGGALVIASAIALGGAKVVANLIRKSRFNPALLTTVRQTLKGNQKLLKEVLDEANPADRALIERAMKGVEVPQETFIDRVVDTPNKKGGFVSFDGANQQALQLNETRSNLLKERNRLIKSGKSETSREVKRIDKQLDDIGKQTLEE